MDKKITKATKPNRKARRTAAAVTGRKPSVKKAVTARKANRKANRVAKGGGKALADFSNSAKIRVLKKKEIVRDDCFRNGQTVAQCLVMQKAKGFKGRRKYIRKQIALKRISLS